MKDNTASRDLHRSLQPKENKTSFAEDTRIDSPAEGRPDDVVLANSDEEDDRADCDSVNESEATTINGNELPDTGEMNGGFDDDVVDKPMTDDKCDKINVSVESAVDGKKTPVIKYFFENRDVVESQKRNLSPRDGGDGATANKRTKLSEPNEKSATSILVSKVDQTEPKDRAVKKVLFSDTNDVFLYRKPRSSKSFKMKPTSSAKKERFRRKHRKSDGKSRKRKDDECHSDKAAEKVEMKKDAANDKCKESSAKGELNVAVSLVKKHLDRKYKEKKLTKVSFSVFGEFIILSSCSLSP